MSERYIAFISYSHADEAVARWLHRAIEHYRFPRTIVGLDCQFGPVPKKLPPVFRDRDELPASGDLGAELRQALATSRFQIVICSPRAAQSKWVNEEIMLFKQQHGEHRTLALIASGEPYAGGEQECFPKALRFKLSSDGTLSDEPAEPIAADIRPGKDGRRLASLKLLAGITGVRLDALARRDAARRHRRLVAITTASMAVALLTIALAIFAENQRRIAVAQRDLAESSLDFLVGTFEVANPATENPRTITALTILDRASGRAVDEFRTRPAVAARLLRATGDIYLNLGLQEESERDLLNALRLEPVEGEGRAQTLLKLASIARFRGDADGMERLVRQAVAAYDADDPNQQEMNALIAEQQAGLAFLRADYLNAARRFASASAHYATMDGDYRSQIAENLMDEAYALIQAGNFTRVDGLYGRATAIFVAKYGMGDVRTARAFHNQAFASLSAGRADAAIPKMERALAIYQRVLEPRHPNLAAAEMLMGRIFTAQGLTSQALERFGQARRIFASLYGSDNPAVGDVDFYAAEAEAAAGRTAAALRLADNVKQIYDVHYGPKDADQAELLLLRARIMQAAGDAPLAAQHCRSALALQRDIGFEQAALQVTERECATMAQKK
jgi:hypothetical protein